MCRCSQLYSRASNRVPRGYVDDDLLAWKSLSNHVDCRYKVRVAAEDDHLIASILISIIQHKNGDIHISALFFRHLVPLRAGRCASGDSASHFLSFEFAENN